MPDMGDEMGVSMWRMVAAVAIVVAWLVLIAWALIA